MTTTTSKAPNKSQSASATDWDKMPPTCDAISKSSTTSSPARKKSILSLIPRNGAPGKCRFAISPSPSSMPASGEAHRTPTSGKMGLGSCRKFLRPCRSQNRAPHSQPHRLPRRITLPNHHHHLNKENGRPARGMPSGASPPVCPWVKKPPRLLGSVKETA